jgi:hypothetical protein
VHDLIGLFVHEFIGLNKGLGAVAQKQQIF